MNEFEIIEKYFAPLGLDGFKDDAAVLEIPSNCDLVVTSDTLNEGTHFLCDERPEFIAHKSLRVNLSDLAAMGADPFCYQLNIAYPKRPDLTWLECFTKALAEDQNEFGVFCSGGDSTSINGPLSISITALGLAPKGQAVQRGGAKAGDAVVLSGPVGDALIGLEILRGNLNADYPQVFFDAYRKPVPQTKIAAQIRKFANAAADVSDGLVADLGHICKASGLRAEVDLAAVPFSVDAQQFLDAGVVSVQQLLTGGDDYQLVMAVSQEDLGALDFPHHVIGVFEEGVPEVVVLDVAGRSLSFSSSGWKHF